MSLLSYYELKKLVQDGVIDPASMAQIGSASIDITLDSKILIEDRPSRGDAWYVDLAAGGTLNMSEKVIEYSYDLEPSEFILASSVETFNLPTDMAAFYCLNSSLGRSALEHMAAGFIDPGFQGKLTLELFNVSRFHHLRIKPGMKIGQITFHKVKPVPMEQSYRVRGQYNGQTEVTASKGLRTPK